MRERQARKRTERAAAKADNNPSSSTTGTVWAAVAGLCAINLAIYSGVWAHDFFDLDDAAYVYLNPHVSAGLNWDAAAWAFRTSYQANWHPLTWLSHMLDVQLFGMNPGPQHAVNLLFHMLNTLLLFAVLRRTTGALGRSAFAAALFAAHPLHVESVAWIAERKDVLSTFFWMLTVYAYVWYVRRPGWGRYATVAALFALGLMSKPMLVTLPFTLLLLDYWPLGRTIGLSLLIEKLPLLGLAAVSSAVTLIVQRQGGAVTGLETLDPLSRVSHAAISYVVYLAGTVWPAGLAPFYPYVRSLPAWMAIGSLAALIGISALAIRARRAFPYVPVGWFWFLGTLVPVIGLVQAGEQAWADRYMYVPLIGLAIVASWGGYDLLARLWPSESGPVFSGSTLAGVAILALSVVARLQASHWQDSYSLWTHTAEVTTNNFAAENGLATALYARGEFDAAIAHGTTAVRLEPDSVDGHINLALALLRAGQAGEAVAHDRAAVRLNPGFALAHCNLGLALIRTGPPEEAVHELTEALRLDPSNREAMEGLEYMANRRK